MPEAMEAAIAPPVLAGVLWLISRRPMRDNLSLGVTFILACYSIVTAQAGIHRGRCSASQSRCDLPDYEC